jgi:hypothetical protein
MDRVPARTATVVQVAVPAVIGWVAQSLIVESPTLKATVPDAGAAVAGSTGLTVAVKVTGSENVVVVSLEVIAVVVSAVAIVCVMSDEVLGLKLSSPL